MGKKEKEYISTTELADRLGVSRVAVFKKIKSGEIKARKIGRNYAIAKADLPSILSETLSEKKKRDVENAVRKVVDDYGRTLELLGTE